MKNFSLTPRLLFVLGALFIAALTRFIPHPPNFTAIGGIALFAGACIPNKWLSLLLPITVMLITDAVIGFHDTLGAVYLSFSLITMIGWMMRDKQNILGFVGTSITASILFFVITNSAVWLAGFWSSVPIGYPKSIDGLALALNAGIPFFTNTLISQFAYGILFLALSILLKLGNLPCQKFSSKEI